MKDIRIKICGLTETSDVPAALMAGADYLGFVFFDRSPRNLTLDAAAFMAKSVPPGPCKVALTVDADDAMLDELLGAVPLDMLQLHGSETPERIASVRERFGLPVMKAVGVSGEGDLPLLSEMGRAADQLLVDAKPSEDAGLPGGNGRAFDWTILTGWRSPVPWMLAGGLTPDNVADAIRQTGARQIDVSSGVESAPGVKDGDRIRTFCDAARKG